MPTHKSAEKCMRKERVRRMQNRARRSQLNTAVKRVLFYLEAKDASQASRALAHTIQIIDKASTWGVIHKNNAARKKSRLTRKVNALLAAAATTDADS